MILDKIFFYTAKDDQVRRMLYKKAKEWEAELLDQTTVGFQSSSTYAQQFENLIVKNASKLKKAGRCESKGKNSSRMRVKMLVE